jgi:hypothetical protein
VRRSSVFLPSCRKPFGDACLHAQDGRYYCSQDCADQARKVELSRVEDLARRRVMELVAFV